MESLIITLDPTFHGGVSTMRNEMAKAHERLGLQPWLAYARAGRANRYDLRFRVAQVNGRHSASAGYIPTIEYLNYLAPALTMRSWLPRFPIVQVVSGSHAASMVPIVARRPFVSWVATPFGDEIASRRADPRAGLSVRINYGLRRANDAVERWTYGFPHRVFALSKYTARRLAELSSLPIERFDVLRIPIDLDRFRPDGPKWERAPGRYILSVGRVDDERKNFVSLLRCFAEITKRHPDLWLVLAGNLDTSGPAVRVAKELGIAGKVRFAGLLMGAELAAAYRSAEAFVMTSRQEGLGIVVLEAQASGLASVIMRCGGSDELVDDAQNGRLVDQGDEPAFVRALDDLLRDSEARRRLGGAARGGVAESASTEGFDRALVRAYSGITPSLSTEPMSEARNDSGALGAKGSDRL